MPTKSICAALLLASGAVAYRKPQGQEIHLEHTQELVAVSSSKYAGDCWKKRASYRSLWLRQREASIIHGNRTNGTSDLPGAGMTPDDIEPFVTVLKDGFMKTACAKDYMLSFGDKFGDGKFKYQMGASDNVSIVTYDAIVPKEDRQPMTIEVCFDFCRTVPEMLTFGIHNGRTCYCAPFFKAMPSDSSSCDAVCEGDNTQLCGGKVKSTVWTMHMCANTAKELKKAETEASAVEMALTGLIENVGTLASDTQKTAVDLQKAFGLIGDPAASNLMQEAKVLAGELEGKVTKSTKVADELKKFTEEATGMEGEDFSDLKAARSAEALTDKMEQARAKGEVEVEVLEASAEEASPGIVNASANASQQYYPLMYFVDKSFANVTTTCTGKRVGKPMTGIDMDACAHACDLKIQDCVGFAHYSTGPGFCFLFSKFTDAQYYTGCDLGEEEPAMALCQAKFSLFGGTSVKPNPSGKCAGCLKTATRSNRCPELEGK